MITHSCGVSWSSPNAAHCPTCHRTFRSASGFDAHRRGGLCLDGVALRERGYQLSPAGLWRIPQDPAKTWGAP